MQLRKQLSLLLAATWLLAGLLLTVTGVTRVPAKNYDTKLAAAQLMQCWMEAVKDYKLQAGLSVVDEDIHNTGLLGEMYTPITTTHGALEAKRTTANPDMAALVVQMMQDAGLKPGDTVGAGFSGSFPALNLAVLAACQTMDINCVYIASVGASTYGGNQPECTFPDMVYLLHRDGLLNTLPVLVTPGGYRDVGKDMDDALREEVLSRLESYGAIIMRVEDFHENLSARMKAYGEINCFVGVGGNLTTTGPGEKNVPYGLIPAGKVKAVDQNSGLVQMYNTAGLPVIHLLNIKQLVAEYGLAYDPETLPPMGTSAVYSMDSYPKAPAIFALAAAILTLLWGFKCKRNR